MVRNERIREEVGQEKSIVQVIEQRQLQWFGHVNRMKEERKEKQVCEMKVEGKMPRGRPRNTWEDRMEVIGRVRGKTLTQMKRECQDRSKWKKWVAGSPDA